LNRERVTCSTFPAAFSSPVAAIALVLVVLGLATDVGLFGWVVAVILGAYVIAALVRGRTAASSR
jgi:hypothetical protein